MKEKQYLKWNYFTTGNIRYLEKNSGISRWKKVEKSKLREK